MSISPPGTPETPGNQDERLEGESLRRPDGLLIEPTAAKGGERGLDHLRRRTPHVGRKRGQRFLLPVLQRQAGRQGEGRADRQQSRSEHRQPSRRQAAQREDRRSADRVGEEDVARPEQGRRGAAR